MNSIITIAIVIVGSSLLSQDTSSFIEYKKSVDEWHAGRINGLKKDHGWLSLIALDWLSEGSNNIPSIGTITISKGTLHLSLNDGLKGLISGKEFTSGTIEADKDKIIIGSKALAVIYRGGKYAVRVWDAETPAKKNFTGIDRYPVIVKWRIEAKWIPYAVPKKVEIPTVIPDLVQEGIATGVAVFTIDGREYKLEPTIEEGSNELFFVFGDKTNGKETYGAGRFLYSAPPIYDPATKERKVILDFNKSYNPPCVFTDYATCPVPSPDNKLTHRIEAGEKIYRIH